MKVVLVPPQDIEQAIVRYSEKSSNCTGLLALAASLTREGIACEVLDHSNLKNIPHHQLTETVVETIVSCNPDVVGFTTMCNNLIFALDICEKVKRRMPSVLTIMGGPGVSFCAKEVLSAFSFVDAILRGEADRSLPVLMEAFANKQIGSFLIPGLVFRSGEKIIDCGWCIPIDNLDDLPIPRYELSLSKKIEKIGLEVGRGCPFDCTFCSTSNFFRQKYRVKSVKRVLAELSYFQKTFGPNQRISFVHDLLTFDKDFIYSLCNSLKSLKPLPQWGCNSRLEMVNPELLERMRDAGCENIFFGIEVATDRLQKIVKKRLNLGELEGTLKTMYDMGLKATLSFMVGFPEEKQTDIETLFSLVFRIKSQFKDKVSIQIHVLFPGLGTSLFKQHKKDLAYDEYGTPGIAEWFELRNEQKEIIRSHPEIFSAYFHLETNSFSRDDILKIYFLGLLMESKMMFSLLKAYAFLGEKLPVELVRNLRRLSLPSPSALTYNSKNSDLVGLMDSIRLVVTEMISSNYSEAKKFEALAQYEIAIQEVCQPKCDFTYKIIKVSYDPNELVENLFGNSSSKDRLLESESFLLVFWDVNEKKVKYSIIPADLALLMENDPAGSAK